MLTLNINECKDGKVNFIEFINGYGCWNYPSIELNKKQQKELTIKILCTIKEYLIENQLNRTDNDIFERCFENCI